MARRSAGSASESVASLAPSWCISISNTSPDGHGQTCRIGPDGSVQAVSAKTRRFNLRHGCLDAYKVLALPHNLFPASPQPPWAAKSRPSLVFHRAPQSAGDWTSCNANNQQHGRNFVSTASSSPCHATCSARGRVRLHNHPSDHNRAGSAGALSLTVGKLGVCDARREPSPLNMTHRLSA